MCFTNTCVAMLDADMQMAHHPGLNFVQNVYDNKYYVLDLIPPPLTMHPQSSFRLESRLYPPNQHYEVLLSLDEDVVKR